MPCELFLQPANHAAVEHSHHAPGQEHEVAGMRVGVVERIAGDHLEIHVRAPAREFVEIGARGGQGGGLGAEIPSSRSIVSTRRVENSG